MEARPSGRDGGKSRRRTWYELRITEESSLSSAVLTRELKVWQSAGRQPRLTVLLMKRSILEQSWAVAKPRHEGAAYNRRARTVALVTSWREEVGSPWALNSFLREKASFSLLSRGVNPGGRGSRPPYFGQGGGVGVAGRVAGGSLMGREI